MRERPIPAASPSTATPQRRDTPQKIAAAAANEPKVCPDEKEKSVGGWMSRGIHGKSRQGQARNNPFCMRLFSLDVLSIPPTAKQKLKDFIHLAKLMKCVWVYEYKRAAPLGVRARHFNKSSSTLYILFQPDVTDIKHLRLQQAKL